MDNTILQVVFRFIHIFSAILAVGGLAFVGFCLLRAAQGADPAARDAIIPAALERFSRIVWIAIIGLVASGVVSWIVFAKTYKAMGPVGNALIGTKVLLALILFALIWAESVGMIKPANPRKMVMAKLHLGLLIILIATVLRTLRIAHGA